MTFILDTNVISELIRKVPDPNVVAWVEQLDELQAYISVITIGELSKGIEQLANIKRQKQLTIWLNANLIPRFNGRIIGIDIQVTRVWGKLTAQLESTGKKMPAIDSLIAATALHTGFVLVTRNTRDFVHTPVDMINPWELS